MALFQKSVINKYLKTLDSFEVEKSFLKFKEFYGNSARLENIRLLKEENYQEGFLREIFVQVLGYTINPDENYNLTTEFKNLTDAKKADGAILDDGKAIGVIELKSTKTTLLESITEQAFNYKNHQPNCRYIITSNFEKIRFYIDNATDFEEFNLFTLSEGDFKVLYLILRKESIFNEIPLKLKKESVLHEENISKQIYQDYSNFKRKIFENLVHNNPQFDKLTLFKKSQKLLDRFLFVLFGEDSGLVPPNAVSKIIDQWKALEELDEAVSLYSRFKKLFHHLDVGHKYKTFEIPAYNGGLFREDEILNSVQIDDEILLNDSLKLSAYDFQTEIDVNILGHIFENSLNEIEELTAEFEGKAVDKKKTKRKKEGVYYTPKYITKYIVENTVGELCNQKKKELKLDEIDISIIQNSRTKQGKLNQKATDLLARLKTYSDYLLSLKILDPACGSGAFLNQALEFLIEEHQFVDEYRRQLEKDSLGLFDIKKSILENNIYGVDINEESVEIAKLSLWLRTAERGRKLSDLNNNIKCGNSLIDDPEVAGEKAFKWEDEFPEIMANGGFDVIIGNPPYVRSRELFNDIEKQYLTKIYETTSYQLDLYKIFIEKSLKLIKSDGRLSLITPSVFLSNDYDKKLRKFILDNYSINNIATTDLDIFQDASVKTVIFVISRKCKNNIVNFLKIKEDHFLLDKKIVQSIFIKQDYLINENINPEMFEVVFKLNSFKRIGDYFNVKNGIKVRKELLFNRIIDENYKPFVLGRNIQNYLISFDDVYIHYLPENEKLYSNQAFRTKDIFEQDKVVVRQILGKKIVTAFDDSKLYTDQTTYVILSDDKNDLLSLTAILNSKLMYFYFKNTFSDNKLTFPKVKRSQLLELPYKKNNSFIDKVLVLIDLKKKIQLKKNKFLNRINDNFNLIKSSQKLDVFYKYDFKILIQELKKQKLVLSYNEQEELEDYFFERKSEIKHLQQEVTKIENEVDQMVYDIYGLSEEEIQIVENSFENTN